MMKKLLLFFSLLISVTIWSQIPLSGLLAHYPFNGTPNDATANGYHAQTSSSAYNTDRFGSANAVIALDGITDSIVFPISGFTPITGDFTVAFWMKTSSPEKMNILSVKQSPNDTIDNFEWQFSSISQLQTILEVYFGSYTYWNGSGWTGNNLGEGSPGKYFDGKWHHFVMRRSNDTLQTWFDRVGNYPSSITYYSGPFGDGSALTFSAAPFKVKGLLDDFVVYNRALTESEITQLYHDQEPLKFKSPRSTDAFVQGDTLIVNWEWNPIAVSDSIHLEYRLNGAGPWLLTDHNQLVDWNLYTFPMNFPAGTTIEMRLTDLQNPSITAYSGEFRVSEYAWQNVTAQLPFTSRDGCGLLNFNGKMWLVGGWDPPNHAANNYTTSEVWNSTDGINWTFVNEAPWQGRHVSGWLVHENSIVVIGGDPQSGGLRDVWKTTDGENWTQLLDTIPGYTKRTMHIVASTGGYIYNFGGQPHVGYSPENLNEVWRSADGINWTQLPNAPWDPRGMMLNSCVDDTGAIWLLGGGRLNDRRCFNDVWKTTDGIDWQLISEAAPWQSRYWHTVAWYDDKIWVLCGTVNQTDNNETWYSSDGITWYELKNPHYGIRHAASTTVYDNALWLMAAINTNDCWKLQNVLTANELEKEKSRTILYPNPARSVIHIQGLTDEVNYKVYDAFGRCVMIGKTSGELSVDDLKKGNYFFQSEIGTSTFIIE